MQQTHRRSSTTTASIETLNPVRPAIIRLGLGLALLTALTAFAVRASAQVAPVSSAFVMLPLGAVHAPSSIAAPFASASRSSLAFAPVPFAVGEELTYKATFGGLPAGSARMRVDGIEIIRGRPAYHVLFSIDGGVPFFRVHDRYESWIDVQTLSSLRHTQQISEGRYHRNTTYEIYPERGTYEEGDSVHASVSHPLDDGSFIYAIRSAGITPAQSIGREEGG